MFDGKTENSCLKASDMAGVVVGGNDGVEGEVVRFEGGHDIPPEAGFASGIDKDPSSGVEVNGSAAISDVENTEAILPFRRFLNAGPSAGPLAHFFGRLPWAD